MNQIKEVFKLILATGACILGILFAKVTFEFWLTIFALWGVNSSDQGFVDIFIFLIGIAGVVYIPLSTVALFIMIPNFILFKTPLPFVKEKSKLICTLLMPGILVSLWMILSIPIDFDLLSKEWSF